MSRRRGDLTAADYVTTQNPYGSRCERFDTLFFNVVNGDNGNWSTPWIIDDPTIYLGGRQNPSLGHGAGPLASAQRARTGLRFNVVVARGANFATAASVCQDRRE